MIQYKVNGKVIKVKPEHEQQFLKQYPTAIRVEGNQQGTARDANAVLQTSASVSRSEDTSSDLQVEKNNILKLEKQLIANRNNLENLRNSIKNAQAFKNQNLYKSLVEEYNINLNKHKDQSSIYQTRVKNFNNNLSNIEQKTKDEKIINADDFESSKEELTWLEQFAGRNQFTDLVSDIFWRAPKAGWNIGTGAGDAYELFEKGADMTDEDRARLVATLENTAKKGIQLDEMNRASQMMEKYKKEGKSGFTSWLYAYLEDPTTLTAYTTQNIFQMGAAFLRDKDIFFDAIGNGIEKGLMSGAVGAGIGSGFLGIGAIPGAIGGFKLGFGSGVMGGISEAMEKGMTTVEFFREQAEKDGVNWDNMNSKAKANYIKKISENKEVFGDIKSRALARGETIGTIDTVTGMITMGLGKGLTKALPLTRLSRRTVGITAGATATTETAGGLISEIEGQKAAGQDFNLEEILLEGFADKTFTGVTVTKGLVSGNPKYILNKQELNGKEFSDALKLMDDEAFVNADIKIENSPSVQKLVNNRLLNIQIDQDIDSKISDSNDRAKIIKLEKKKAIINARQKNNKIKTKSGSKLLTDIDNEINEITSKYENSKVDVTIEDRKKAVAKALETKIEKQYNKNLKFAEQEASRLGKTIKVIKDTVLGEESNTSVEMEKLINEHNKANPDNKIDLNDALNSDGFFVGDQLVINENVAKQTGQINVGAHELLHSILEKQMEALKNSGKLAGFIKSFRRSLTSEQDAAILKEINRRISAGENLDVNTTEEWLTIFSDKLTKNELSFNEGLFDKFLNWINSVIGSNEIYNFNKEFGSGRAAYNFMKDYQASIEKNKLSEKIVKTAETDINVDEAKTTKDESKKASFSMSDAKIAIDKLGKIDGDGQDMTEAGVGNFLYQAEADEVVRKIKEEGYLDNLIAAKYKVRPVPPEFVDDVLAELTPHIKAFKPETNDSLFGWINSQIANKAGNVYNKIYKDKALARTVDIDATTSEGAPVVQIEADPDIEMQRIDEIGLNDEQVQDRSKFRRALKLDDNMVNKVINTVKKAFGTKLPNINTKQFKQALAKAFKTDLKKPMQDLMGKGKTYDAFLEKFMPAIYKHLPVEVLVQMERNLSPDLRIFTSSRRITKPVEVDKLIAQGRLPKNTNRLSGPLLNTKLPYPGTDNILAFFRGTNSQELLGYKKGASTYGTRKDVLAERTITEVAFDAVSTVIQDKAVASKIEDLNIAGIDKVENDLAVIAKQIDRDPTVKFSVSGKKIPNGYTSAAFVNDASIIIADIKASSYEAVIEENEDDKTGDVTVRLVKGYEGLNIPQFTVNAVANLINAAGSIENAASIGFKAAIKNLKNKFSKFSQTIDYYSGVGNLWDANSEKAKTNRKKLSEDVDVIIEALGEAVMDATKFNIFGYQLRMFDPASRKKDKAASKKAGKTVYQKNPDGSFVEGNSFQDLENKKKNLKDKKGNKLPKGLILEDVRMFNSSSGLLKKISDILKIKSKKEKLAKIAKLQPEIDAANKANILLAKHIVKTIITLVRQNKINPISALHIFQMQTSIVLGLRALSRLDLIDIREGSQDISEVNPSFKDAVKYYSNRGLKNHINEIKNILANQKSGVEINPKGAKTNKAYKNMADKGRYVIKTADGKIKEVGLKELSKVPEVISAVEKLSLKKMGTKGEHLGPNANTMSKVASLIFDTKADIDKVLNKAFRGHSQMLTSKYITDIIDNEGGKNNNTDFNRVKFLDQSDIDAMVSADNKSYIDVLANHEINILSEDLFVDKSNAVKVQELQSKPVSIRYSKSKGMSTFDFDETLIIGGRNFVVATKDGKTVRISSEQWPIKGPALAAQGYEFDFSDFLNVRGGKQGPLLQKMKNQIKKYGPNNVFVLTARMQDSAKPIHEWLKTQGINIPLKNITGLGKSEGEAKAQWMLEKFAEGYNDMYFVDDSMSNVKAVKQVLDNLDIKSKVVQAKIKFSKSASVEFNKMIERNKGIDAAKEFSSIDAKLKGAKKGRFTFFVPPSAEDFKGLIYGFLGKGEQGNKDLQWFKDNLFTPFSKGIRQLNSIKQRMTEEYTALKKSYPEVVKSLNDKITDTDFTVDNAIRVYLWNLAGFEVPGLSESEKSLLIDYVNKDAALVAYADSLSNIARLEEGYIKPSDYWITQNIGSDLTNIANKIKRETYLSEWQENVNLIFSKENLNKIEAVYGSNFREALEDILYRMKTGSNRPSGRTSTENKFLNWINGSIGAVMFFNMRSALLQNLSMVNFLNFEDNNIFAAAKAFANQKQYWSDFSKLFNSDMLKQRRAGLKIDVSASELTDAFAQGKNKAEAVLKYLLEKGFLPTQLADSFAIASGGATFYRNRINKYLKEGMSQSEAEQQAFLDFQEIAEETQQSSRPDLISMQQASSLGRIILAWANTPMQYTRLTKKALSDLINGRGDARSNVSRIIYYGAVQNIIFGSLQTGLAFLLFGDDEDKEDRNEKERRVLNGMLDTLLRGIGVYGALFSTAKNTLIRASEELGKNYGKKDYSKIMQELVSLSPPIGSKVRKIMSAIKGYDFNKDIISQMDHGINNPAWNIFSNVVEGVTNAPVARIQNKLNNVREAFEGDHEMWQRIALVMGWNKWDLGIKDTEIQEAREKVKQQKKEDKEKAKEKTKKPVRKKVRCVARKSNGKRCKNMTNNKGMKCYAHQ